MTEMVSSLTPRRRHRTLVVADIVELVRNRGAGAALAEVRAARPALHDGRYHDTAAVFVVWAADRLLTAGLTPTAALWHPLLHAESLYAWWDAATLESAEAAAHFVPTTLAAPGEPAPCEPAPVPPSRRLVAA